MASRRRQRAQRTVNTHVAKTTLSQSLKARLRPRRLGRLNGRFRIPDDFNDPLPPVLLEAFLGRR